MKILGILWLLVWTATAGEISERYWAERKADTNLLQRMQKHRAQQMFLRGFVLTNGPGQFEISHGNIITNHGVTEIGIERTRCFGRCPDYTFVVSADGRCRYEGGEYAKLKGKKIGRASLIAFHRVAELLRELKFIELEDEYEPSVTDNPTTYTTAVINGKRKTVRNYADGGPSKLWAIEKVIDDMLARVRWDE